METIVEEEVQAVEEQRGRSRGRRSGTCFGCPGGGGIQCCSCGWRSSCEAAEKREQRWRDEGKKNATEKCFCFCYFIFHRFFFFNLHSPPLSLRRLLQRRREPHDLSGHGERQSSA